LPVRNGGEYIKECVQSILAQTYKEFTLHILDNNSQDGTSEWLESISDPRIEIIRSAASLTIEENWARVLQLKKNAYMTLIGHDDILYPDFLKTMHELIIERPDSSLYTTHFDYINAKGFITRASLTMSSYYTPVEFLSAVLKKSIDIVGTGFVMKSEDYEKVGGIPSFPSLLFADFALWIKLVNLSGLFISQKKCFSFRVHQSTTSLSKDEILLKAFDRFIHFLSQLSKEDESISNLIKTEASYFLLYNCKGLCHRLLRTRRDVKQDISVKYICEKFISFARILSVDFIPQRHFHIRIALIIDGSQFFRFLFLKFKKLYPKPLFH
jgi:glycosyltransferase involved in cell wall biosynthesis